MAVFPSLTSLIDRVKEVIYPNTSKAIKAKFHQPMLIDIVETLWGRGCEKVAFSSTSTHMAVVGNRMVCGNQLVLDFAIDFTDNSANGAGGGGTPYLPDSIVLAEVVPQDYEGFKWLKVEEVTILVDEVTGGFSTWGTIEMNDLSSYNSGVLEDGDTATFNLWQTGKGVQTYYDFGDQNINTLPDYNLDQDIIPVSGAEYLLRSPKDLTLSPLNITFKNAAAGPGGTNATNKFGTIKFLVKASLM